MIVGMETRDLRKPTKNLLHSENKDLVLRNLKKCNKCLEIKDLSNYYSDKRNWDQFQSRCKNCQFEKYEIECRNCRITFLSAYIYTLSCSPKCAAEVRRTEYPEGHKKCLYCKNDFYWCKAMIESRPNGLKFCSKKCWQSYVKEFPKTFIDDAGYIGSRHGRMHRRIMENHLGRTLPKNEHVHHINGNKQDNRLENLMVLPISEHMKFHRGGVKISKMPIYNEIPSPPKPS